MNDMQEEWLRLVSEKTATQHDIAVLKRDVADATRRHKEGREDSIRWKDFAKITRKLADAKAKLASVEQEIIEWKRSRLVQTEPFT